MGRKTYRNNASEKLDYPFMQDVKYKKMVADWQLFHIYCYIGEIVARLWRVNKNNYVRNSKTY